MSVHQLKLFVPPTSICCISAQKDKEDYDKTDFDFLRYVI